jgi:hypothetical protein
MLSVRYLSSWQLSFPSSIPTLLLVYHRSPLFSYQSTWNQRNLTRIGCNLCFIKFYASPNPAHWRLSRAASQSSRRLEEHQTHPLYATVGECPISAILCVNPSIFELCLMSRYIRQCLPSTSSLIPECDATSWDYRDRRRRCHRY